ncbi:MAG: calcium/sodium antiporter [Cyanobacteria bacterium P01_F01_bin.42]
MSDLWLYSIIFVVSLGVLVKASDIFTDAADRIGVAIGLPPFIVGVTIVSVGTSVPELLSSIIAVLRDSAEIVVGNVVGSNIVNICLVIGVTSLINAKSLRVTYDLLSVDLPLFAGSAFLFALMCSDQRISTGEAFLLLIGYVVYFFYIFKGGSNEQQPDPDESSEITVDQSPAFFIRQLLILAISSALLFCGAKYTIDSLIELSQILNVGKELIAVSAVAFGTSIPELMVSANSAMKGKAEIAIGNVLGSNIFNIFVVVGIPGLLREIPVPGLVMQLGIPTMIAASILMFFSAQDRKVTVWEGWLFLMAYAWFLGQMFQII